VAVSRERGGSRIALNPRFATAYYVPIIDIIIIQKTPLTITK